jgi:hypothetical protein
MTVINPVIKEGNFIKLKEGKDYLKVTSIYIDTKELGCPEIVELENGYKIRMTSYSIHPDKLIEGVYIKNSRKEI